MPAKKKPAAGAQRPVEDDVASALAWMRGKATRKTLEGLARYGIPSEGALGVSVADLRVLAKELGRDHDLALALWETGVFEARMLCAFVDDPARVTPAQMDRWCRSFRDWAVCDGICFHLFDRTPHAWDKVRQWSAEEPEFVRRAGFALLASLAGHDKKASDAPFLACLPLAERGAADGRNFVKKAVSWALRRIGTRNAALHAAATDLARRLAESHDAPARWVGKDVLRDLARPLVARRIAKRGK